MKKLRRIVYIAGPISATDPVKLSENLDTFAAMEAALLSAGYAPYNPASDFLAVGKGAWSDNPITLKDIMQKDKAFLICADVVFCLTGWEKSKGARKEVKWAHNHDIPVVTSWAELHDLKLLGD